MINKRYFIKKIKENSRELFPIETGLKEKGKISDRIKCILFDIYGTLFVSGSGDISTSEKISHQKQMERILLKYGISKNSDEVYYNYLNSIKKEHERLKIKGVLYPEIKVERIWKNILNVGTFKARKIAIEYETLVNPIWPMPGVLDLLSQLKLMKVQLGIISNAQFYTPMIFDALLGRSLIDLGFNKKLIFFSYKYGIAKPSLELFKLVVKRLNNFKIKPKNTVYVGNDILNDIKPAINVGFKTVLFAGDKRSLRMRDENEKCRDVKPDIVITSLISILNRINF